MLLLLLLLFVMAELEPLVVVIAARVRGDVAGRRS